MKRYNIYDLVTQRPPYLMVDEMLELHVGERCVSTKYFSLNEPCLSTANDTMEVPETLLLEMIRQSSIALINQDDRCKGRFPRVTSIVKLDLLRPVYAPSNCRAEIDIKSVKSELLEIQAILFVESVQVLSASIEFALHEQPSQPKIHATATIHPTARLGKDVVVGPNSVIGPDVIVGNGTIIEANVIVEKWVQLGENNHIYSGTIIGSQGQDIKYKGEEAWVKIGDRNEIREYVTINRPTGEGAETRIGSDCMLMVNAHVAHNCIVDNNVILANGVTLGGHSHIEEKVVIGGMSGLHQFLRVGKGSMLGAYSRFTQDIPPFMLCHGNPAYVRGLNSVGLRRGGYTKSDLVAIKSAYKSLYRSNLNVKQAMEEIKQLEQTEGLDYLIQFLETETSRGISKKSVDEDDSMI